MKLLDVLEAHRVINSRLLNVPLNSVIGFRIGKLLMELAPLTRIFETQKINLYLRQGGVQQGETITVPPENLVKLTEELNILLAEEIDIKSRLKIDDFNGIDITPDEAKALLPFVED